MIKLRGTTDVDPLAFGRWNGTRRSYGEWAMGGTVGAIVVILGRSVRTAQLDVWGSDRGRHDCGKAPFFPLANEQVCS